MSLVTQRLEKLGIMLPTRPAAHRSLRSTPVTTDHAVVR
jgi:hypothetical protein